MQQVLAEDYVPEKLVYAIQYGDEPYVSNALEVYRMSPNTVDRDGCTLLHWAAINNRIRMARYLLQSGAAVDAVGGELRETPLLWAVRDDARLYMTYLLIKEGGANIHFKSVCGHDALYLACQHNCTNLVFMLLTLGADPNTSDTNKEPVLHWLLRNSCEKTLNIQRLLINFKASVVLQDATGNTALHIVAGLRMNNLNVQTLPLLYEAGGLQARLIRNRAGRRPFDVAKSMKHSFFMLFLYDAFFYKKLPYIVPIVVSALYVIMIFVVFHFLSLAFAIPAEIAMWFIYDKSIQATIYPKISRNSHGIAWGILITIVGSYYVNFADKLPLGVWYFAHFISFTIFYSLFKSATTRPSILPPADPTDQQAMSVLVDRLAVINYRETLAASKRSVYALHLRDEAPEFSQMVEHYNAPVKLCTTCMIDRSAATTHCMHCGFCVKSLDHHCVFVNNCVAIGNRRFFLVFTGSATLGCVVYAVLAFYLEHTYYCPYVTGHFWNIVAVQWCMFNILPAIWAIKVLAISCVFWIGALFMGQLMFISSETTSYEIMKGHTDESCNCSRAGLLNVLRFLWTGTYRVVRKPRSKEHKCSDPSHNHGHNHGHIHSLEQIHDHDHDIENQHKH